MSWLYVPQYYRFPNDSVFFQMFSNDYYVSIQTMAGILSGRIWQLQNNTLIHASPILWGNVGENQRGVPTCRHNLCSYSGHWKYSWIQGPWDIWFQLSMYHRDQGPPSSNLDLYVVSPGKLVSWFFFYLSGCFQTLPLIPLYWKINSLCRMTTCKWFLGCSVGYLQLVATINIQYNIAK